ncbi:MAG: hypothetical protein BJ554DRAFT_6256 [Olpidium bornovanus]|uniref:mitogen-activated protein kinase kinase n=1 Tax=Olpidium bornovanus TaxID=278681 RepID=A0A8H7ZY79_9FUNG|nr:MAG: hypothetical protein BJ554DRAFT_6256 [Olpidium bornovanus]
MLLTSLRGSVIFELFPFFFLFVCPFFFSQPERISSAAAGVYTVQADVWSLGLSLLEVGRGEYPYPPDKYDSVFAQLTAIAQGEPPPLSPAKYSFECRDFVSQWSDPKLRPTYAALLEHAFIKKHEKEPVDMKSWVRKAYASRKSRTKSTTSPE